MSIDSVVAQVRDLLTRAHTLFGDPPAAGAGADLAGAVQHVQTGRDKTADLSARLIGGHQLFAQAAAADLTALAAGDKQLGEYVEQAAAADRRGRVASGAVAAAAAIDVAALTPLSDTPAGQHALLNALRARLAEQQRIVAHTQARAAVAAAGLRARTYQPTTGPNP